MEIDKPVNSTQHENQLINLYNQQTIPEVTVPKDSGATSAENSAESKKEVILSKYQGQLESKIVLN